MEPPLFAIADGMGGAQAGEVASRLATAALTEPGFDAGGEDRIVELIQEANRRVYDRSSTDPKTSGMGTTITVALVEDEHVAFGHVGDSRAYLIRDARIEQLTEDHSLVNELLKTGKLSQEEAEAHPQRSVITRALGTDPDVDVDTFSVTAQTGDLFLLCSDGLTDMVAEDSILDVVEGNRGDIEAALRALVKEANRGGGQDNITVVAFEIAAGGVAAQDGDTREQALPQAAVADDEDTLTEADAVPVVDTAVISADAIQAEVDAGERDERAVRRRHLRRRLVAWLVVLLLMAAALLVVYLRFLR
jgi:PPM family protein phosphatase